MKGLLIPLVMALLGAGIGGGAAFALKPAGDAPEDPAKDDHGEKADDGHGGAKDDGHGGKADDGHGGKDGHGGEDGYGGGGSDYVRIDNQFVVPVIEEGRTRALVVMALALDVAPGMEEAVLDEEPRLRDALLRVLFDHANTGGFAGAFTRGDQIEPLRAALLERARGIVGPEVEDVLILDVARQET